MGTKDEVNSRANDERERDGKQSAGKYFTKALLVSANQAAGQKRLNRQLVMKWVRSLPNDVKLPIILATPHHFAGGKSIETHMRCTFVSPEGLPAAVDCSMEIYDSLPGDAEATPKWPVM